MPINREMSAISILHRWICWVGMQFSYRTTTVLRKENTWNIWTGNVSVTDFNLIWWREREREGERRRWWRWRLKNLQKMKSQLQAICMPSMCNDMINHKHVNQQLNGRENRSENDPNKVAWALKRANASSVTVKSETYLRERNREKRNQNEISEKNETNRKTLYNLSFRNRICGGSRTSQNLKPL